jgi:hypothetical protein
MSRLDWARERSLVSVEARQNGLEESLRSVVADWLLAFAVAVEFEKLGEQGKDKCKGNLGT